MIFGVAVAARLAVVAWAHTRFPPTADGAYYDLLARRLAGGHGYTWLWPGGAVTDAAHYPVGYPAMLAISYALSGPTAAAAMTLNAVLGAASASAVHALVAEPWLRGPASRWRPAAAGLGVALHPALVPYTAAVMTEGVTASLLTLAAAAAVRARSRVETSRAWFVVAGLLVGLATLVRPQSLVFAPVLGALVALRRLGPGGRRRGALPNWMRTLGLSATLTAIALVSVSPWTIRNCVRMHRCALVSVNGGWNLLIGATTTTGGWQPVRTPTECATVWDEAEKDICFGRAGWAAILAAPGDFVARAPKKLALTLDVLGAAPSYLHESAPAAFGDLAKRRLEVIETIACRLALVLALLASALAKGKRPGARRLLALSGAVCAATEHAFLGYLALVGAFGLAGRRAWARAPLVWPLGAAVVGATLALHSVFFGAGRYGLVVVPFVVAMAFVAHEPPLAQGDGAGQIAEVDAARAAARRVFGRFGRKVRAPQSTVPGNAR